MCSSDMMIPIIKLLHFRKAFWMRRFVPIAYILGLIGILYWKKLKLKYLIIFLLFIFIDCILRFQVFILPIQENTTQYIEQLDSEELLVSEAIDKTENRFAFIDLSSTSSYQSYQIYQEKKKFAFGWAYQGAATMHDIMSINEAFEYGYYDYAFSRLIILEF